MTTLTNIVKRTDGSVVPKASIDVTLVDLNETPVVGYLSDSTIVAIKHTVTNVDGMWSLTLPANSDIEPANTYYLVEEHVSRSTTAKHLVEIPSGSSTVEILDVLVDAPSALGAIILTGGGSSAMSIADEGVEQTDSPTSIDFVGAGVTATHVGDDVTVTIPGGGGGGSGDAVDVVFDPAVTEPLDAGWNQTNVQDLIDTLAQVIDQTRDRFTTVTYIRNSDDTIDALYLHYYEIDLIIDAASNDVEITLPTGDEIGTEVPAPPYWGSLTVINVKRVDTVGGNVAAVTAGTAELIDDQLTATLAPWDSLTLKRKYDGSGWFIV